MDARDMVDCDGCGEEYENDDTHDTPDGKKWCESCYEQEMLTANMRLEW